MVPDESGSPVHQLPQAHPPGAPSLLALTCQVSESSCSCSFSSRAEATASPSRTLSALSSSCSLATLFSSGSELFLCGGDAGRQKGRKPESLNLQA